MSLCQDAIFVSFFVILIENNHIRYLIVTQELFDIEIKMFEVVQFSTFCHEAERKCCNFIETFHAILSISLWCGDTFSISTTHFLQMCNYLCHKKVNGAPWTSGHLGTCPGGYSTMITKSLESWLD